jgi:hypothetical protein
MLLAAQGGKVIAPLDDPREIEEQIAAKEKAYQRLKESEIFSTEFQVTLESEKGVGSGSGVISKKTPDH